MDSKYIHDYYDYCHKDFKRIWHLDRCMAMHMGFWDNETRRLRDALLKENEILANKSYYTNYDEIYGFYEVTDILDEFDENN